jgi:Virulence factor SrfB
MSQIHVFPESGHHYAFVHFEREHLTAHPTLRKLCEEERIPWTPINNYKWLRGRLGMNEEGHHGMWVAMESNLGDAGRGAIYENERIYHEAEAAQFDLDNPTPYAAVNAARLPDEIEVIPIDLQLGGKTVTVAKLEIIWKKPAAGVRDVDLIIDFGNTRTVVLALEHNLAQIGKLASLCKPVRFTKRGADYIPFQGPRQNDTCAIVDSWFILHEPMFAEAEPPRPSFVPVTSISRVEERFKEGLLGRQQVRVTYTGIKRVPQMFVELSPAVMGDSARDVLAGLDLDEGGNYTMSSPKRFVWDKESLEDNGRQWWTMVQNRYNPQSRRATELPKLKGALLRFLPLDGTSWDINNPPHESEDHARRPTAAPDRPSYPRADTMAWSALSIIELAYRQITSQEWRKSNDPFVPRRLRRVLVTFPSGWSKTEISEYKEKWQQALNIFTLAHLKDKRLISEGGDRPDLIMEFDEAVASQLPIVFSEIKRLKDNGRNWIELFGTG